MTLKFDEKNGNYNKFENTWLNVGAHNKCKKVHIITCSGCGQHVHTICTVYTYGINNVHYYNKYCTIRWSVCLQADD